MNTLLGLWLTGAAAVLAVYAGCQAELAVFLFAVSWNFYLYLYLYLCLYLYLYFGFILVRWMSSQARCVSFCCELEFVFVFRVYLYAGCQAELAVFLFGVSWN